MAIQAAQEHDRFISLWAEEKKRLMEQVAQAKDNEVDRGNLALSKHQRFDTTSTRIPARRDGTRDG